MLNVNALNKTLSAMSLPQLQNYASMHKDDPYVVAMALSIANTKKQAKLAEAGLAGAGAAAQPTVVDQDIAGMAPPAAYGEVPYSRGATPTKYEQVPYAEGAAQLPEDSGIGQLPAQNMQRMAEGGIVAFADGGDIDGGGYFDPNTGEFIINEQRDTRSFGQKVADAFAYKKGLNIDPAGGIPKPPAINPQGAQNARDALLAKGQTSGSNLAQQAVDTVPTPDTGAGIKQLAPAAVPTGTTTTAPQTGLGGFMDYLKANQPADPESMDTYMKRREAYLGENPTKKQMERIDKQEAQALAEKEDAKAMAFVRAGLGMLSGTSQHALTNIGQGATAGLEDYAASQKDAKKLKLERDKMRDAVENAAYAYKKGDMDSYEKYAQDARNARNTYAAHGLSALGSVTGAQIHANATMAAANAMPANMRAAMALGEGATEKERLESGLAKLNALSAEKTDLTFAKMYADHVNNAQKAMQEPMTPTQFATTIRSALAAYKPKVVDTDKPSGTVYDR